MVKLNPGSELNLNCRTDCELLWDFWSYRSIVDTESLTTLGKIDLDKWSMHLKCRMLLYLLFISWISVIWNNIWFKIRLYILLGNIDWLCTWWFIVLVIIGSSVLNFCSEKYRQWLERYMTISEYTVSSYFGVISFREALKIASLLLIIQYCCRMRAGQLFFFRFRLNHHWLLYFTDLKVARVALTR